MSGETGVAPFLSARLGVLSDGGGVVDGCGREVCRGRGGVISMSLLFSCLTHRTGGENVVCSSRGSVSSIPSRCAFRCASRFLSCECLVMTSRRGAAPVPFVFLSLRFARGHERWLVSIRLSRVSLRLSSRLIRPVFFLSSSERVARRGAGRSARVGVLFFFLWRGRSIPALRLARRVVGARREMMRGRRFIQLDFSYLRYRN